MCTSAPWKNDRYACSRRAMYGFPRSGRPITHSTCLTPRVPAFAAMGGGTAVGSGLFSVACSRCSWERTYGSISGF